MCCDRLVAQETYQIERFVELRLVFKQSKVPNRFIRSAFTSRNLMTGDVLDVVGACLSFEISFPPPDHQSTCAHRRGFLGSSSRYLENEIISYGSLLPPLPTAFAPHNRTCLSRYGVVTASPETIAKDITDLFVTQNVTSSIRYLTFNQDALKNVSKPRMYFDFTSWRLWFASCHDTHK